MNEHLAHQRIVTNPHTHKIFPKIGVHFVTRADRCYEINSVYAQKQEVVLITRNIHARWTDTKNSTKRLPLSHTVVHVCDDRFSRLIRFQVSTTRIRHKDKSACLPPRHHSLRKPGEKVTSARLQLTRIRHLPKSVKSSGCEHKQVALLL